MSCEYQISVLLMTIRRTAVDINFVRTRIFYARPSRDPDAFRIVVGLPYNRECFVSRKPLTSESTVDALNRLRPAYFKKPRVDPATYKAPDPRGLEKDARHLSKYIFPSQYGLSSVFILAADRKERYQQPDYTDREREIKVRVSCMYTHDFNVHRRSSETVKLLSVSETFYRYLRS